MTAPASTSPLAGLRTAVAEWLAAADTADREAAEANGASPAVLAARVDKARDAVVIEAVKIAAGPDLAVALTAPSAAPPACPTFDGFGCEREGLHTEHAADVEGYGLVTWNDATADRPPPPRGR